MDDEKRIWKCNKIRRDMFMWSKVLISILVFTVFVSCLKKDRGDVYSSPSFIEERRIEHKILVDELILSYPLDIFTDSKNVYVLALSDDKWLHVYDKKSGVFRGSYISRGNGIGEIVSATNVDFDTSQSILYIFDQETMKMLIFELKYIDKQVTMSYKNQYSFTSLKGSVRDAWKISGDKILTSGNLGSDEVSFLEKRFQMISDSQIIATYDEYPIQGKEKYAFIVQVSSSMSLNRNNIAFGTLYGATLEIFSMSNVIDLKAVRRFYKPNIEFEGKRIKVNPQNIYGFSDLITSDNSIYGILIGDTDPNKANNISVFDWEGKEKEKFITDCLIYKIHFDTQTSKIYAIKFSKEMGVSIVTFDLN